MAVDAAGGNLDGCGGRGEAGEEDRKFLPAGRNAVETEAAGEVGEGLEARGGHRDARVGEGEAGEVLEDATFHGAAGRHGGQGEKSRKVEQAETKKELGQTERSHSVSIIDS